MILFLLLVAAYRFLVYGPLTRMLKDRRERTLGAVEKAHAAIATADARTQEYEARLRAARAEIFHRREEKLQQWNAERDAALESARLAAQERIKIAHKSMAAQVAQARQQLDASAAQLAADVLRAVLPAGSAR